MRSPHLHPARRRTLEDYLRRFVQVKAHALNVPEATVIAAAI
jgi:hypothetical protein